jgi:Cu(I)/Ag(I) efflux system membrane protein CusA/SilA
MTVSVSLFGLVPILWSTGTGADVMIPLRFRLLRNNLIYVLLVTPIVFEMTKQHELRTKGNRSHRCDTLNIISLSVVCF